MDEVPSPQVEEELRRRIATETVSKVIVYLT
jgi:hypothetical protein